MEHTDAGTPVGVDDPYDHVDRCDHLTDEGRCRFAMAVCSDDPSRPRGTDPDRDARSFADRRRSEEFRCPVAGDPAEAGSTGPWEWADCPQFRSLDHDRACRRCGLAEVRLAHDDERPLLEEHHLSYADSGSDRDLPGHEITVYLCRWCHAKVHDSWARIDDDAAPDAEAIAERERRRAREQSELDFSRASDRFDKE